MIDLGRRTIRFCAILSPVLWFSTSVSAVDQPKKPAAAAAAPADADGVPAGSDAAAAIRKVLERVSALEREVRELRVQTGKVPVDKKDQRVVTLLETPHLGSLYYGSPANVRFFAAKLMLINLTEDPLVLKREDLQLVADGQTFPIKDVQQQFQYQGFQVGQQNVQLRSLSMARQIALAPGGMASTWVLFPELPAGNHVPQLTLKVTLGEKVKDINVNANQRDLLGLNVERLGPKGCLGLITISGTMNTVNAGSLVAELDRLSADKVTRAVIHWTDSAVLADQQMQQWLQNAAVNAGRQAPQETQFPTIPVTLRELHLASLPNEDKRTAVADQSLAPLGLRVHKTEVEAVIAALRSAYETLPRDELFQTIATGPRLERAAALAGGAGRLAADKLPMIVKLADDEDAVLQQAAIGALAHFGEPEAIEKLLAITKKNAEPFSSAAISSLAGSRYAVAHAALLDVLNNEAPASKKSILKILALYPRPIWSEAIYQFVKDPRAGLNIEALNALVQVGHPKLVSVLEDALKGTDDGLQQQAFHILAIRSDRESEEIAMNYTLQELAKAPPTPQMLGLLNRVKDKRALPLLIAQFDKTQNRSGLIQTLALIGDQETAAQLAAKYPQLQSQEKGEALRALNKLNSAKFRELAAQALLSPDSALVGYAAQGLQEDGGPEAIKIMIDALDVAVNSYTCSYLCNALAVAGTPAARAALTKARDTGSPEKRNYAIAGLTQIRQRSPGFQYVYQAQAFMRQEKWKEAVEQFDLAIQLDPQLPEAYAERANVLLRQEKFADAGKDYSKAYELDPYNSQALTGKCIVMVVVDGKYLEATKMIEDERAKFPNNPLFSYNSACVFGRAVEHLKKDEKAADREKLTQQYSATALSDLKRSVELGLQDFDWMRKDPDLKSLHELPEFQKLSQMSESEEPDADPGLNRAPPALPVPPPRALR